MYFDAIKFGKRISELRKRHRISQERMAEMLNMSRAHLAHIEIGQRSCSIDLMMDISAYFDVSLDYLITGEEHIPVGVRASVQEAIRILSNI